jgi:N-acetylglutamate synthase
VRDDPPVHVTHLERVLGLTWPGIHSEPFGGWLLRAGRGVTSRANSALVLGDPGVPTEEALDAVAAWYRTRGLPPRLQIAASIAACGSLTEAEGGDHGRREVTDAACARRGWVASPWTWVMTRPLDGEPDAAGDQTVGLGDLEVAWSGEPPPTWSPERAAEATAAPALFATVRLHGEAAGVGRLALAEDWAVLTDLTVEPQVRGRGIGGAVVEALCRRAKAERATAVALQVLADNPARRLYRRLGFSNHHAYRYRTGG